jgi:thioredoxin-related protein
MIKYICFLLLFCISSTSYSADFILNSLKEAKNISKNTKQSILLIFGSNDCAFCVKLKDDISNGELTTYVDSYIICYVDIKENTEYKKEYKVNMIPDSRIIKNEKEISKATGYNKNDYSKWLQNARK